MNSSTLNLYENVIRKTIWSFLAAWTTYNLTLQKFLFYYLAQMTHCYHFLYGFMFVFMMTLYRTEGGGEMLSSTEVEQMISRRSWTVCVMAAWSSFWSAAERGLPIW